MVIVIKTKEELNEYLKEKKLVVIDFFASWCGPCKFIAPKYEELSKEHTDVTFLKVDGDDSRELTEEYGITGYPTFFFIKDGENKKLVGANAAKLEEYIKELK
ncbi:hypothetical protein RclHR1_14960001 [Rhizophagus clarus]|uniref:Thioredoxin n=1 Tax=Rhizophagus clarus TaxID=94130 RepID=A0A2Z6R6H3_9GLOM|nr:hypothetical protein RclHR1_14960001 [Rhizophagus clarus]